LGWRDPISGNPPSTQSRPSSSYVGTSRSGRSFQAARQPSQAAVLGGASDPQVRGIATATPWTDDLILTRHDVWYGGDDETKPVEPTQRVIRPCRGYCVGALRRIGLRVSRESPGPADGGDALGGNTSDGPQGRKWDGAFSAEAAVRRNTDNADGNCGRSFPRLTESGSALAASVMTTHLFAGAYVARAIGAAPGSLVWT
jgi:hypothetical protein